MPLKPINFTDILQHCDVLNTAHSCQNDYKQIIIKGQAFFKERFVKDIQFKLDESENFIIRSTVKEEIKKRENCLKLLKHSYHSQVINSNNISDNNNSGSESPKPENKENKCLIF